MSKAVFIYDRHRGTVPNVDIAMLMKLVTTLFAEYHEFAMMAPDCQPWSKESAGFRQC